jgi:serine/threonine protein kinase
MSLENLLVHQNGALIIDMGMCLRIPYPSQSNTTNIQEVDDSFTNINLDAAEIMINGNDVRDEIFPWNGKTTPRQLITPQGTCGKWIYMSPEIYKNDEPFDGFAVDMWAAGVILFLMLTGFPPWERACMTDDRFKYMTAGYLVQMLTEWKVGLSSDAMDLLQRMLFLDPKDRLSLDQVKAHPWMMAMRTP